MSTDGELKFCLIPYSTVLSETSPTLVQPCDRPDRLCGYCHQAIAASQPPVLVKSGQSLHLECYLAVRKVPLSAATS